MAKLTFRKLFNTNTLQECHLLGCDTMWLLLRTDVLEELTSIITVKRLSEIGTALAVVKQL
jgi:hypothetical protein